MRGLARTRFRNAVVGAITGLALSGGAARAQVPAAPAAPGAAPAANAGAGTQVGSLTVQTGPQKCCSIWDKLGTAQVYNGLLKPLLQTQLAQNAKNMFLGPIAKTVGLTPAVTSDQFAQAGGAKGLAANVEKEEQDADAKIQAIQTLARHDCTCYPEIADTLLEMLNDCTERVRFEALKALHRNCQCCKTGCNKYGSAPDDCPGCQCQKKVIDRLQDHLEAKDDSGGYKEKSPRIRQLAQSMIDQCMALGLPIVEPQAEPDAPPVAEPDPAPLTHSVMRPRTPRRATSIAPPTARRVGFRPSSNELLSPDALDHWQTMCANGQQAAAIDLLLKLLDNSDPQVRLDVLHTLERLYPCLTHDPHADPRRFENGCVGCECQQKVVDYLADLLEAKRESGVPVETMVSVRQLAMSLLRLYSNVDAATGLSRDPARRFGSPRARAQMHPPTSSLRPKEIERREAISEEPARTDLFDEHVRPIEYERTSPRSSGRILKVAPLPAEAAEDAVEIPAPAPWPAAAPPAAEPEWRELEEVPQDVLHAMEVLRADAATSARSSNGSAGAAKTKDRSKGFFRSPTYWFQRNDAPAQEAPPAETRPIAQQPRSTIRIVHASNEQPADAQADQPREKAPMVGETVAIPLEESAGDQGPSKSWKYLENIGRQRVLHAPFEIDSVEPATFYRLRFDAAYDVEAPDRAEFYWARIGGRGPRQPDNAFKYQDVRIYSEVATPAASAIIDFPLRFLETETGRATGGLGDMTIGVKSVLAKGDCWKFGSILKTYMPTGSPSHGTGNGHVSLEPGVLANWKWSEYTVWNSELKYWIPLGGDPEHSGEVLHWGVGVSHVLYSKPLFQGCHDHFAIIPTFEVLGWMVQDGNQTILVAPPAVTVVQQLDGLDIWNVQPGVRFVLTEHVELGVSAAKALTGAHWYDSLLRFDLRWFY